MKGSCANAAAGPPGGRVGAYVARRAKRRAAGFSLAEMMVVIAIIAIVGAVAVFRPGNALYGQRATAAAQRIVTDLALAQRRAVQSSTPVTVEFNTTTHSYRVVGVLNHDFVAKEYTIDLTLDPYKSQLAKADFAGPTTVTFGIYGAPSAAGEIVVASGGMSRTILVDAVSGRATIQ